MTRKPSWTDLPNSSLRYNIGTGHAVVSAVADKLSNESGQQKGNLKDIAGIEDDQVEALVEALNSSKKICVIYNPEAINSPACKKSHICNW